MVGRVVLTSLIAVAICAACSSGGGNESLPTSAGLDISGMSNAPCTLTIDNNGRTFVYEIAAPLPAVAETTSGKRTLTSCQAAAASMVSVTTATSPTCVSASRTSTALCFVQQGCLSEPLSSDRDCPSKLTLTCSGQKLYDAVPIQLCAWFG